MKALLTSTAILLASAIPALAQGYTPDPDATPGGMITVTYKDDVATLDPAIGYDWQNWSMIKSLFDGLMDYVPGTTELRPGLAESYEVSEDGTVFTFGNNARIAWYLFDNTAIARQLHWVVAGCIRDDIARRTVHHPIADQSIS